jgi:glycosyltransferase involved in cell wall biosynthesis
MVADSEPESSCNKINEIISSSACVTPENFPCGSGQSEIDVTIFIACFNEEENIIATIGEVVSAMVELSLTWEIIIIDDASTDNSVSCVQNYINNNYNLAVKLIVRKVNQGLARNFLDAAVLGRGRYYKLVCGDNVESREHMVLLMNHLGKADILIPNAKILGRKLSRRMLSSLFTGLVNLISGYNIKYYNGCSVHLRQNVVLWHKNVSGFDFQAKLILVLLGQGKTYLEIPVIHHERSFGRSHAVTLKNILSAARFFVDLAFYRLCRAFHSS